jgi:nicotinate-nucleotide pyrophosphorylase
LSSSLFSFLSNMQLDALLDSSGRVSQTYALDRAATGIGFISISSRYSSVAGAGLAQAV